MLLLHTHAHTVSVIVDCGHLHQVIVDMNTQMEKRCLMGSKGRLQDLM